MGETETQLKKYENFGYGLSFLYPREWGNGEDQCMSGTYSCGPAFFFSSNSTIDPDESRSLHDSYFIDVRVIQLSKPSVIDSACNCTALRDFVAWDYTRGYQEDWTFINDNQTLIGNNYSAWQTEMQYSGIGKRYLLVHSLNGNTGYIFTYSGPSDNEFGRYLDDFRDVLKTVTLIDPPLQRKPSFLN
jgi:hypothetical protein